MIIAELAQYIHDNQLGVYDPDGATGNIYLELMPEAPDDAIAVYSTGGMSADVTTSVSRPAAQILVRGAGGPIVVGAIAWAIHRLFDNLTSVRLSGGTRVMLCQCRQSEPISLGPDENDRQQYSINLMMITGGD